MPKVWATTKRDKLDFIKIKHFCSAKYTVKGIKFNEHIGSKLFAKHTSDKGLYPEYKNNLKTKQLQKYSSGQKF